FGETGRQAVVVHIRRAIQASRSEAQSTQGAQSPLSGQREVVEAKAPKHLVVVRRAVVDAGVKRILVERPSAGGDQVVGDAGRRRRREQSEHGRSLRRYERVRDLIIDESSAAGPGRGVARQGIKNLKRILAEVAVAWLAESAGAFYLSRRNRVLVGDALLLPSALVVAEEKELVLDDGPADRTAKLFP